MTDVFTVTKFLTDSKWRENAEPLPEPTWTVFLPHQCGPWLIAGDTDLPTFASTQEEAIQELETFLADGQRALEALRKGETYGEGEL